MAGPQTELCRCNLTPASCNDSPGGRNDFLHWCCHCRSLGGLTVSRAGAQRDASGGGKLEQGDGARAENLKERVRRVLACPEGLLPFFIHKTVPPIPPLSLSHPVSSCRRTSQGDMRKRAWQVRGIAHAPGKLLLQPQTQSQPRESASFSFGERYFLPPSHKNMNGEELKQETRTLAVHVHADISCLRFWRMVAYDMAGGRERRGWEGAREGKPAYTSPHL